MNLSDERSEELLEEDQELFLREQARHQRRAKRRMRLVGRIIDRIFGFVLATLIMLGAFLLGLEYVIVKGPSPAWRDSFVQSMLADPRTSFVPNIFLSQAEIDQIAAESGPGQRN